MPDSHSSDLDADFDLLDRLSQVVRDYSFGTIWWVDEEVWVKVLRNYSHSGREKHPGLSIRNSDLPPQPYIPLLHGRSDISGGFIVTGVTIKEPSRRTCFQFRLRGEISLLDFELRRCFPAEKQKLSEEEMKRFRSELSSKGLL